LTNRGLSVPGKLGGFIQAAAQSVSVTSGNYMTGNSGYRFSVTQLGLLSNLWVTRIDPFATPVRAGSRIR